MSAPSVEKGIQSIKGQIDAPVASFLQCLCALRPVRRGLPVLHRDR